MSFRGGLPPDGFRMRASLIAGFRHVAENLDRMIDQLQFSSEDESIVPSNQGVWTRQGMWMSARIVEQFNFFISFELALKFLLTLTGKDPRLNHKTYGLYRCLPDAVAKQLDALFTTHALPLEVGRALLRGRIANPEDASKMATLMTSLGDFCRYCDEESKFAEIRYGYEKVERDGYLHFIRDLKGLLKFLHEVETLTNEYWVRVTEGGNPLSFK